MFIRLLDITLSILGLVTLSPIILLLSIIGFFDTRSPIFVQERLGKNQTPFKLIKFRTMQVGTSNVASHLAKPSDVTAFGGFLRKTKLDEIPQLFNVIKGDMSMVGPRPGLTNQVELLHERKNRNVFDHRPGITGLAQVNNIDMSTPRKLSRYDALMMKDFNLCTYIQLLIKTISGKGQGDKITYTS